MACNYCGEQKKLCAKDSKIMIMRYKNIAVQIKEMNKMVDDIYETVDKISNMLKGNQ